MISTTKYQLSSFFVILNILLEKYSELMLVKCFPYYEWKRKPVVLSSVLMYQIYNFLVFFYHWILYLSLNKCQMNLAAYWFMPNYETK